MAHAATGTAPRTLGSHQGMVERFDSERGYGFIAVDGGGRAFVHYSGVKMDGYKYLADGQRVAFDLTGGKKGLRAENVRLI